MISGLAKGERNGHEGTAERRCEAREVTMQIRTKESLAYTDRVLTFSMQEKAALLKAAGIAEEARDRMREVLGVELAEDHPYDLYLAEIEHNSRELLDGFIIDTKEAGLLR
jgi:hypothetical protein